MTKNAYKRIFSVLCVVLLVFSTLAPSLASASTVLTDKTITVNAGSDTRTINKIEATVTLKKDRYGHSGFYSIYNSTTTPNALTLTANNQSQIDPVASYQLTWKAEYTEGDNTYLFIDQQVLTGAALLTLGELKIPTTVKGTKIIDDAPDLQGKNLKLEVGSDVDYASVMYYSYFTNNSLQLVVPSDSAIPISYALIATEGTTSTTANVFVSEMLDFTKPETKISDGVAGLKAVTFDTQATNIQISKSQYFWGELLDKNSKLSKGDYTVRYSDTTGNWYGSITVNEPATVTLPAEPTELKVNVLNTYTPQNSTVMNVSYEVKAVNGAFTLENVQNTTWSLTSKLYKDTQSIGDLKNADATTAVRLGYNDQTIDLGQNTSGTYQLKVEAKLSDTKTVSSSADIKYTSNWQELKGTVFSAKNSEGTVMTDTIVTLYEKEPWYKEVITEKATANGEVFIPDAYILKGQEYVAVVKSESNKVLYTYEFTGQSENVITLDGTTLKSIQPNYGGLTTTSEVISLVGTDGETMPFVQLTSDWKISTAYKLIMQWTGKSSDGKIGYAYSDAIDFIKGVDFSNIAWESHKPLNTYTNAYLSKDKSTEQFSEYKTYSNGYYIDSVINLNVTDGTTVYSGPVYYQGKQDIAFGTYTGQVNGAKSTVINTSYVSNEFLPINITDTNLKLTYELKDSTGQVQELTTSSLYEIPLTTALAEGTYTLSLKSTSLTSPLASLTMQEQTVEISNKVLGQKDFPQTFYINNTTPYGDIDPKNGEQSIFVYTKMNDSSYYNTAAYYYRDYQTGQIKLRYGSVLDPAAVYKVIVKSTLVSTNTSLNEVREMTGQEILGISEGTPFAFSEGLKKLSISIPDIADNQNANTTLRIDGNLGLWIYLYNYGKQVSTSYVSPNTYSGFTLIENDVSRKLIEIPTFEVTTTSDKELTLTSTDLAKLEVIRSNQPLPIFEFNVADNHYYRYGYNQFVTSHYITKKTYNNLRLGVGVSDKYDTPWGYTLSLQNENITADKQYAFPSKIDGVIDEVLEVPNSNILAVNYQLTADNFNVENIYHAVKSTYGGSAPTTDASVTDINGQPVRMYYGLFDSLNVVPVQYTITDVNGKKVFSGTYDSYGLGYINMHLPTKLKDGSYTLSLNIPTGPRQSLPLTKTFSIGGPAISVDTPTFVKDATVTIAGTTTATDNLTVTVLSGTTTVATKTVTPVDGKFTVDVGALAEGKYTVEVSSGQTKISKEFAVDRTAPVAASDVKFTETTAGLQVDWKGASDAASYIVEVATGSGEFVAADSQTTTTYTIANVQPGTTYKVRVKSIDAAGNVSVSTEVTHEVAQFATTSIALENKLNANQLLTIGDKLAVTLKGSFKAGYAATAVVTVDGQPKNVPLTYNADSASYTGIFTVEAGMKQLSSIKGYIEDGATKTNEKEQVLNWSVGSTVSGTVSDGGTISGATVRFKSDAHTYSVVSDAQGAYSFKGIAAGTYAVSVTLNGLTTLAGTVVVTDSEVKTFDATVTATVSPVFNLVNSTDKQPVANGLRVRIEGPNGFASYGTTQAGKFVAYGGYELKNIATGDYTVTVFGEGLYSTTAQKVTLTKETNYTIEVQTADVKTADVVITLPQDITKIDAVSLYSTTVTNQFNYNGVGSYYAYDISGNKVTLKNVVLSDNYSLYVAVEGYLAYKQVVDITNNQNITINLEKGREISGTIIDSQNATVGGVYVSAWSGNTYASTTTKADGTYTLKGLSKTEDIQLNVYSQLYLPISDAESKIAMGTDNVTNKNFQLAKAASITGKVVDKAGNPLKHVSVSVSGDGYSWARTATDGTFSVNGLKDNGKYTLEFSAFGYPSLTVKDVTVANNDTQYTLQKEGTGVFNGEGNFFAASKATVVPGDKVQFTLGYQNNGTAEATNVPVTLTLPTELSLIPETVLLNGKAVTVTNNKVIIPSVTAGASGKLTFEATVASGVVSPSLTATAQVANDGAVLSASTSVVFVTLEAPAQTGAQKVKVYGSAKLGSTVEVYANGKLVGQAKVDSKWWFADIQLPVADSKTAENFTITAKATSGGSIVNSQPTAVKYVPDVPTITDVTVKAGWNGNVKLNPYTGVATFAITENTWMPTTIKFDTDVTSASLNFLGETYAMTKDGSTFTYNGKFGDANGKWTSYGEQLLEVTFKKGDVTVTLPLMNILVLIDPSGYVFEGSMSNKLEGVQAIVETKDAQGNWVQWDAAKFGQVNPQVTDAQGRYGWDVITGEWRVIFTKDGYEPYISRAMNVPPPETELNIPMVKVGDPAVTTSAITANNLTVTFDRYMDVASKNMKLVEVGGSEVAGTIETVDVVDGYKAISKEDAGKATGFAGKDSKNQDGFFTTDTTKKVSKTFKFKPSASLKAGTVYKLVINGEMADTEGRKLGNDVELSFTTATASGGSGGGGGGGGGAIPPTPTVPTTPPAVTQDVKVDDKAITEQLNNSTAKTVEVTAPAVTSTQPAVNIAISTDALKSVVDANKSLTVQVGQVNVVIPGEVLKTIATNTAETANIAINLVQNSGTSLEGKSVTPVYEFTITVNKNGSTSVASQFAKPIEITIPVNAELVKDPNKVAVYYINEKTNKLEYVFSKYKNGIATFKTNHFSQFVVVENNKTFKDVQNSWAKTYIESLASKSIITGKSATAFGPSDTITRAQFAVLLTRVLGLPKNNYQGVFSDVDQTQVWSVSEIEAASKAGIIQGSNGKFKPNDFITRQQMATMIIRALNNVDASIVENANSQLPFADNQSIASYAKQQVGLATALGIINGKTVNGKQVFAPNDNATRAEAAKMLYLMLEKF